MQALVTGCVRLSDYLFEPCTYKLNKVDGYLARNFNQKSTLGTILDPAADKALVTTLTVSLGMRGLLPCTWLLLLIHFPT